MIHEHTHTCMNLGFIVLKQVASCIYVALMPLIAVIEALVFAVTGCFAYRPLRRIVHNHNEPASYTAKDFARLADETTCMYN